MNVVHFTPIISKALGTSSLGLESRVRLESKFSDAETKLANWRKIPTCLRIGVWFDCGGSRSSARVQRVWRLLFRLCPSSLLRKSSTLCCILFDVVRTCGLFWEFILLDALDKDWDKIHQYKNNSNREIVSLPCRHKSCSFENFNVSFLQFDVKQIKLIFVEIDRMLWVMHHVDSLLGGGVDNSCDVLLVVK